MQNEQNSNDRAIKLLERIALAVESMAAGVGHVPVIEPAAASTEETAQESAGQTQE